MSKDAAWLPPLLCLEEFGGAWNEYVEAVYSCFKTDFLDSAPSYGRRPVRIKRHPLLDGREATFWHITSEGREESQRVPDLRRCERVRWPRPIIEHAGDDAIRSWSNKRGNEKRIVLWSYAEDYVVVLADRGTYVLLWTAYLVTYEHTRRRLLDEYKLCH